MFGASLRKDFSDLTRPNANAARNGRFGERSCQPGRAKSFDRF